MNIGEKIRNARIERGMTQQELGELIGVKNSAIAKYESGRVVNIKRSTLKKIADILGMHPYELIFEDDASSGKLSATMTAMAMRPVSTPDGESILTKDESHLVNIYRNLAEDGKKSLLAQAEMHAKVFGNEKDK